MRRFARADERAKERLTVLQRGCEIVGKWTGQKFIVEQQLGTGANGEVYVVRTPVGRAAMKVCARSADIALEWGLLERLANDSNIFPKPMLIDDDRDDAHRFFYVMEWVPGRRASEVLKDLPEMRLVEFIEQVMIGLRELHRLGYAFCDVKPDNILVTVDTKLTIRFVDVGGITPFGRSVRQFTPFYDRAYWSLGSRQSDAAYDICGIALMLLCTACPPPQTSFERPPDERRRWLGKSLRTFPAAEYTPVLHAALTGQICDGAVFFERWQSARRARTARQRSSTGSHHATKRTTGNHLPLVVRSSRRRRADWTQWLMWGSLCTAATVTLAVWGTFMGWF